MLKKVILLVFTLLSSAGFSQISQYKGLAISGNSQNRFENVYDNIYTEINNTFRLHYFISLNHVVSIHHHINYGRRDFTTIVEKNISVGFSYKYIHSFGKIFGVESTLNFNGLGRKKLALNFELDGSYRITNDVDLIFRISEFNFLSKTVNSVLTSGGNNSSDYKSTSIGIPQNILSNLQFRLRIPENGINKNNLKYIPRIHRNFGLKLKLNQTTTQRKETSFQQDNTELDIGIGFIFNPLGKYSFSLNYNNLTSKYSYNKRSEQIEKYYTISAILRRNYLLKNGIGFFMQGGPLYSRYNKRERTAYGFVWEAGLALIIKDRIMIDGTFSNLEYRHIKQYGSFKRNLELNPFTSLRLSATLLF